MAEVIFTSSVCGHHFNKDCRACQSAKESNDNRLSNRSGDEGLRSALAEIAELQMSPRSSDADYQADYWHQAFVRVRDMARAALATEWRCIVCSECGQVHFERITTMRSAEKG